jgi:hypothetical protein
MNLNEKLTYVDTYVRSISEHTDVDASVRKAALDKVIDLATNAKQVIDSEVAAQIDALK